ncbi:hypothetical protein ACTJJP_08095 [Microbacterium sp. 22296]
MQLQPADAFAGQLGATVCELDHPARATDASSTRRLVCSSAQALPPSLLSRSIESARRHRLASQRRVRAGQRHFKRSRAGDIEHGPVDAGAGDTLYRHDIVTGERIEVASQPVAAGSTDATCERHLYRAVAESVLRQPVKDRRREVRNHRRPAAHAPRRRMHGNPVPLRRRPREIHLSIDVSAGLQPEPWSTP